jgi:hypothetical protein
MRRLAQQAEDNVLDDDEGNFAGEAQMDSDNDEELDEEEEHEYMDEDSSDESEDSDDSDAASDDGYAWGDHVTAHDNLAYNDAESESSEDEETIPQDQLEAHYLGRESRGRRSFFRARAHIFNLFHHQVQGEVNAEIEGDHEE